MNMTISEIYSLFKKSSGITTDTRKITANSIYFALKGENFNGNTFAEKAIENGALVSIVDEEEYKTNSSIILVENVLETLQKLANYHRTQLNIPIIGLTGSNGKTTTKELINCVLSKKFNTTATLGNLNNHIGVPLTLLSMTSATEMGIVEMGANHQKEIELLASIAQPNFGYITNFGKAHLEGFGGVEGVIKGKTELYQNIEKTGGIVFINSDDPIQIKHSANIQKIFFTENAILKSVDPFIKIQYKNYIINTHLIGAYNYNNIVAAITMGEYFKVSDELIVEALENYIPTNNRSQIIEKKFSKIILDAYNANPTSMTAALTNFNNISNYPKTVILGDMFELGETSLEEHQMIADLAASFNFDTIVLIGENFSKIKTSKAVVFTSFEAFKNSYKINQNATFLIKASRGMALERIVDLFD